MNSQQSSIPGVGQKRMRECEQDGQKRKLEAAQQTLEPAMKFLKGKKFSVEDLTLSSEFVKFTKVGEIPCCFVWALLWSVFGCRIETVQQAAFVIKNLHSRDLCHQTGSCSTDHQNMLMCQMCQNFNVSSKKKQFQEDFTWTCFMKYLDYLDPLKDTESLIVRCKRGDNKINHAYCIRQTEMSRFIVTDQGNPKGMDVGDIQGLDVRVLSVCRVLSPDRKLLWFQTKLCECGFKCPPPKRRCTTPPYEDYDKMQTLMSRFMVAKTTLQEADRHDVSNGSDMH